MTLKDDSGEAISKRVLDWLTGLITLAAALTTIFGVFFSEEKAKPLAFGIAFLLVLLSGGVFIYQRRRAAKLKITESLEPLSATAALRGLLPFEEGDQLPGRARDVQELYTLVASSTFRFGVLWGESGCGKTSLLRAGLVPKLRNEKFLSLYINKPTNNPQEAIRSALLKEVPGSEKQTNKSLKQLLEAAAPKGKKFAVIFDQFEEFFLTNRTPKSRASFIKWLGESIADEDIPVVFLISIRSDFFAQLQNLAPQIPEPTSIRTTYQLQNFDTEQAKQIFSAAAKADGIPFEPALIQAVVKELETEEFIRPAELQVVGTRLKHKHIFNLNRYEALGGARGVLSSYIGDEIRHSMNQQAARLILRLMCADVVETKSQTDLSLDDILHGVTGTKQTSDAKTFGRPEEIQAILNQFVAARVLIHTDEDKYNLVHDYLAPYVRTATEGTETNTERANRMLKRYVAEYKEDPKTRIPFGRVRWIKKYASADVKSGEKALELMKTSRRGHYGLIASTLSVPIVLYLFLAGSYYFSVENSYVVLRAGHPLLKFLPGFDQVAIQTDFKESDLDPKAREKYLREQVTGLWFQRAEGGYQVWGEKLVEGLTVDEQARALHWMGQTARAEQDLIAIINDDDADPNVRAEAANALGQSSTGHPDVVTPSMIQSIIDIITTPETDFDIGNEAVRALGKLAQTNPEAVTSEMIQSLVSIATNPEIDYRLDSYIITGAIEQLVQNNPEAFTPDMLQSLVRFVTDQTIDSYARCEVADSLGSVITAKPQGVTSDMLKMLIDFFIDPKSNPDVRSYMSYSNWSFEKVNPQAVTPEMIQTLIDFSINPQVDSEVRSFADYTFLSPLAQANPRAITPDMIQMLMSIVDDPEAEPELRSSAAGALGQLVRVKPEIVTPDLIPTLMQILMDPQQDSNLRSSAAGALGQLAQARPGIVTPHVLQTIMKILADPETDSKVRSSAASALGSLAEVQPETVLPDMLQSLMNIITDTQAKSDLHSATMYALESIAKSSRHLVTPEIIQLLVVIATDPQEEFYIRVQAANTLGELAQENPKIVTPDVIQSWVDIFTDPQFEHYQRSDAANTLGTLARVNPQAVTPDLLQRQMDILNDPQTDSDTRSYAAQALGLIAQADPEAVTLEITPILITLLKSDTDSPGRQAAAYTLFGIALRDKEQENMIRKELEDIQDAPQPHWRIAASRTVEMLEIGNLLDEVRAHPEQIEKIKSRLISLGDLSSFPPYFVIGTSDEEHLQFAAQIVMQEIEKIEAETK